MCRRRRRARERKNRKSEREIKKTMDQAHCVLAQVRARYGQTFRIVVFTPPTSHSTSIIIARLSYGSKISARRALNHSKRVWKQHKKHFATRDCCVGSWSLERLLKNCFLKVSLSLRILELSTIGPKSEPKVWSTVSRGLFVVQELLENDFEASIFCFKIRFSHFL